FEPTRIGVFAARHDNDRFIEPFCSSWHKCLMDQRKLISALATQDPEAIEQVVHAYGDRLLRAASLLCGNEADAQDLVQETFVQALGSVHRFRGHASIYTWLRAILLNLTRHYHRSRTRLVYDDEPANREVAPTEDACV